MKRHFPGIHTIQVLWPGKRFAEIDTLILPHHDLRESQADIRMLGALHDVDPDELQRLAHTWPEKWGKRETPVASVLVGAPHSATPYDWPMMKQWLDRIASTHAALLVTTSRRTPRHWAAAMRQRYGDQLRLLFDPSRSTADNPYTAMLAVADRIFVTPDSVSMISEAMASNVQVVVPDWPVKQAKFQRFLDVMVQHAGLVIGSFSGTVVSRQPVWDLPQVVQQIRQQCIID